MWLFPPHQWCILLWFNVIVWFILIKVHLYIRFIYPILLLCLCCLINLIKQMLGGFHTLSVWDGSILADDRKPDLQLVSEQEEICIWVFIKFWPNLGFFSSSNELRCLIFVGLIFIGLIFVDQHLHCLIFVDHVDLRWPASSLAWSSLAWSSLIILIFVDQHFRWPDKRRYKRTYKRRWLSSLTTEEVRWLSSSNLIFVDHMKKFVDHERTYHLF